MGFIRDAGGLAAVVVGSVLCSFGGCLASSASADTVILQSVDASIDDKAVHSTHQWSLSGAKFRLQVTTGEDQTQYIFNGHTLYACGRLNQANLNALTANKLQNLQAFAQYKDGACQVVPTNFMVRFFLSPMPSVESVDRSDGLKLTLGLRDYQLTPGAKPDDILGHGCAPLTRRFTLTKSSEAQTAASTTVDEQFCQASDLTWRDGLWTEVAKASMRQPHSGDVLRILKRDMRELPGFILRADSHQTTTDRNGKTHTHHFVVKTTSVKEAQLSPRTFGLPEGYKLFSDDSATLAAAAASVKKKGDTDAPKDNEEILKWMSSAFFCALAGSLACIAGP